jgi:MATE family multidrug resistance protein
LLALNRDLFLRTLLLTGVMLEFTRAGAQVGAVTLAANAILFQMFMLSALILDGFETAAQVLCGEAAGRRDGGRFRAAVRACLWPGWMTGVGIAAVYALAGGRIAASFSLDPAVRDAAAQFVPWAAALPVLGVTSFVLDGVFVGAGWARAMLGVMAVSFALFNAALHVFAPLGNHGLWLAFCLLFVARAGDRRSVCRGWRGGICACKEGMRDAILTTLALMGATCVAIAPAHAEDEPQDIACPHDATQRCLKVPGVAIPPERAASR